MGRLLRWVSLINNVNQSTSAQIGKCILLMKKCRLRSLKYDNFHGLVIGNIDINLVVVYTVDHPEDGISDHLNRLTALLLGNHVRKIDCNIHRLNGKLVHFTLFNSMDNFFCI